MFREKRPTLDPCFCLKWHEVAVMSHFKLVLNWRWGCNDLWCCQKIISGVTAHIVGSRKENFDGRWKVFPRFFDNPNMHHWPTLTRSLEAERLETPREGGRVDDVHAVLALAPPVESDGNDQQHDRHHARSQARVQGHIVGTLPTYEWLKMREKTFWMTFCFHFLNLLRVIRMLGDISPPDKSKLCVPEEYQPS